MYNYIFNYFISIVYYTYTSIMPEYIIIVIILIIEMEISLHNNLNNLDRIYFSNTSFSIKGYFSINSMLVYSFKLSKSKIIMRDRHREIDTVCCKFCSVFVIPDVAPYVILW